MLDILQHAPTAEYTSWRREKGKGKREKRWERVKLLGKRKNTTLQHVPAEQVLFNGGESLSQLAMVGLGYFMYDYDYDYDFGVFRLPSIFQVGMPYLICTYCT